MWLARDKDGRLFLYFSRKPAKLRDFWSALGDFTEISDKFPSVKWEDDEPTKVKYNKQNELEICK